MTKLEHIRNLDDETLIGIISGNLCVTTDGKIIPCVVKGIETDCRNCIFATNGESCTDICECWLKDDPEIIKVGDIVAITDTGKLYTTYFDWVALNIKSKVDIAKYAYGSSKVSKEDTYKVLQIAPNDTGTDRLAYITRLVTTPAHKYTFECYLISVTGLKKVGE